ncbi:MAG: FliI/YscN family ATPase, partial [Myxococcales bacterium]|nr:FliI/YscN family ATPase [Myxococcales bacterium]
MIEEVNEGDATADIQAPPSADPAMAAHTAPLRTLLGGLGGRVAGASPLRVAGLVTQAGGLVIEGRGPASTVGGLCEIQSPSGRPLFVAEVVGFRGPTVLLMPLGQTHGLEPGCRIVRSAHRADIPVGPALIGRVINGLGMPIDGKGPIPTIARRPLYVDPVNPMERKPIREPLDLGVRSVNALLTIGKGQRVGIMAGSGVGKSTLLGMMARYTKAEVNVIGLIGERGRELREFIERDLGPEGLKRSVVVVATSDDAPLVRRRGAFLATSIAEYFRDQGRDVLMMMDSVTRFAMAQREIGLAVGEPPATRGYPPSVFA